MAIGTHDAQLVRATLPMLALALVFAFMSSFLVMPLGAPDADAANALLTFKDALDHTESLENWNLTTNPCDWNHANWVGVLCLNGSVSGLQLENKRLTGTIAVDSLLSLPSFRTISLMNNKFEGPLPDIKNLGKLQALYLSNNRFSGNIPDNAFEGMDSLRKVYLAHNAFTGNIPLSLTTLPRLMELRLEGNQFQGQIPDFQQKGLKTIHIASNGLEGPIPSSLSHLNPNSFSGNKGLCGPPLEPCETSYTPPTTATYKNGNNILKIIIAVVVVVVTIIAVAMALAILRRQNQAIKLKRRVPPASENSNKIATIPYNNGDDPTKPASIMSITHTRFDHHNGKLSFVRDDLKRFDLQELLRASAEVLGSGAFGASYKAVMMNGLALVVKRYRHMNNVGRDEFDEHMRRLGMLKHPNLLPLSAYHYRKEEKLLVSKYMEKSSLASHLHGNRSLKDEGLDWQTRLKIIKGIAKGLAYLYAELPLLVPHGHLKSSNVLLDESMEPRLTDYALRPLTNPEHAHALMIAYKSPEYARHGRTSNKTDIWSFGILMLEILTGKFPENYLTEGYDSKADLASWVNEMVKEKKTSEVFDKEMMGAKKWRNEMIRVLKIGLSCCEEDVERRLEINEVVEMIEGIKEGDDDHMEDHYYGNEKNVFRVRGNGEGFSLGLDR